MLPPLSSQRRFKPYYYPKKKEFINIGHPHSATHRHHTTRENIMKTEQSRWIEGSGWQLPLPGKLKQTAQLAILFGSTTLLRSGQILDEIKNTYPKALLWGCSTAGEIFGTQVLDNSLTVTAVQFEHTEVKSAHIKIDAMGESFHAGEQLVQALDKEDLAHVLVLSDGLRINGSDLVRGLTKKLPKNVSITGGLSGDGDRFKETLVLRKGVPDDGIISVLGLYGTRLKVGYGSLGGWDPFGPERLVTKSKGNVLYEMDGRSALELYKQYLGEHAQGLPATGLLFPLSIRSKEWEKGLVRTILAINEKDQSMIFAGDVPEGAYAQLMKANFDRLIDGASGAATTSYEAIGSASPDLAILISCVGRKMILKQRVEEEIEEAAAILGKNATLTGFYSYGEISPFAPNANCELHNQTMTITTLLEE